MSNCNYTSFTDIQIVELVRSFNKKPCCLPKFLKFHQRELLDEIVHRTSFLEDGTPVDARLYCLINGIHEHPICSRDGCSNLVGWTAKTKAFKKYCCFDCAIKDPNYWDGMHNTMEKRYGVRHALQCDEFMDKSRKTCMSNFGVEYSFESPEVQRKISNTNEQKYGFANPMKSKVVQDRVCESNMNKYGVEYPLQSDEIKDRLVETNFNKYGVGCVFQSEKIKDKIKDTMLQKYEVEYYSQTSDYHKKAHKPYTNPKYPGMTFGSSWEFLVYDFLKEHNIGFEYQPSVFFDYVYDNKYHTYHPDFKIGDRIFEVKGEQFFNESGQMVNPYDHSEDGKYEAKHQCMLSNDVVILREKDIENLSIDLFK